MQFNPGSPEPLSLAPVPLPMGGQDHFELLRTSDFRNLVLDRRWAQEDVLSLEGGYPNLQEALLRLIESLEHVIEGPRGAS